MSTPPDPSNSLDPEALDPEALDSEALDSEALDSEALDSEDWIPDEWLPNGQSNRGKAATKNQPVDLPINRPVNEPTNPPADELRNGSAAKSKAVQKPQKHSAELFPIPPAVASAGAAISETYESYSAPQPTGGLFPVGPLPLVETAFLASAASLMWLINTYFPPGPLLRILFPLPITLVYLRWNLRAAWMAATVSGLLLTILLGPTRSIFFVMPYGLLGVQLGCLWRRRASWELSIITGGVLVALGTFFRLWLLSLLAGEDLWGYLIAQITQFIDWIVRLFTSWGWIGLGTWGQPNMEIIAIAAIVIVLFSSMVYLFTVHLAAWLVLERLGVAMPEPPDWVQALIEE
jgi:hypothetical protein